MKKLHNDHSVEKNLSPEEGELRSLCSNNRSTNSPSLDSTGNLVAGRDRALDQLAEIIVELHFEERELSKQKSINILPGIDEGTS